MHAVNLKASLLMMKYVARHMVERCGGGRVVDIVRVPPRGPGVLNVNYFCRRIDSRFLLPSRRLLPHVNCYPAAELRGAGGDGEATEHGDTPRA